MTNKLRAAVVTLSLAALAYALLMLHGQTVQASDVPQCEKVAETPNLAIYLCEPDNGPPFYINSYGFMVNLE